MKTVWLNKDSTHEKGIVLACGLFDGVHAGHQKVLNIAKDIAKEKGLDFGVLTFTKSTLSVLLNAEKYIFNLNQRMQAFEEIGADVALMFETNKVSMMMSGQSFIDIMMKHNVKHIVCGQDFRFGTKASSTWKDINLLSNTRIDVSVVDFKEYDGEKISSSTIIEQIINGQIEDANKFLYMPYTMNGVVVKGKQLGRKLGFPTANVIVNGGHVVPKKGVYHTLITCEGKQYHGVTNVGSNPTIDDSEVVKAETFIIDFNDDIYGKEIHITFKKFVREEKKFSSIDELKNQVLSDIEAVKISMKK